MGSDKSKANAGIPTFDTYIKNVTSNWEPMKYNPSNIWISEEADKLLAALGKWTNETAEIDARLLFEPIDADLITDVKFQYSERTGKTTTIVWFADGDKVSSVPSDDDVFEKRIGIEQCILKKIFGSRSRLKKFYERWC